MNIYVGNLSWSLTEEDLTNLFSPYGEVTSAKIITDKFNGNRSKGFGFVEMADDEAGKSAIAALNETEMGGRKIIVNESQPRENTGTGGGGGGFKKRSFGGGGGGGNRGGGGGYGGSGGGNRGGGGGYGGSGGGGYRGGGNSY